jgi:hypothetical protein
MEIELGDSWVGWWIVSGEPYVWQVRPEQEAGFADLKAAFFGDAEPTPFGTPLTTP